MHSNTFYKTLRNPFRSLTARIIITTIAAVVITLFIPRESDYSFVPERGKPWPYGQVIAPYDFPIYKSDEALRQERDSVMSGYQPYYNLDESVLKRNMDSLQSAFAQGKMQGVPSSYMPRIASLLQEVYSHGVMNDDKLSELKVNKVASIRVLQNTSATATPTKVIFSRREAYRYMMDSDSATLDRNILQLCDLNAYIEPNLTYNEGKSETVKRELLSLVVASSGLVLRGQKIIDRGEIVDNNAYLRIISLNKESQLRKQPGASILSLVTLGYFMLVSIFIGILMGYIHLFRRDYYEMPGGMALLLCMVVIFPVITGVMVANKWFTVFIIPYVIMPVFIRIFMDARTAFFSYVMTIMLCSLSLNDPYVFVRFEILMGAVAIFSLRELTQRSQLIRTAAGVIAMGILLGIAGSMSLGLSFSNVQWYLVVAHGVFLLFAYPLMLIIEKTFGFTSAVTLVELSNTNNPLLRRMSVEAQGSFNHSMQVANLSAEVANRIGGKVQLVRTGAMYHDIGKMSNPAYFTENQSGVNLHDNLTEVESAQIIIGHVKEGLKLADKYGLPRAIKNFISTHHGKGKVKYFYIQHRNKYPDEPIDEAAFTYPGPNPYTKEQAILMMADSVEACSRSLQTYDEASITKLVNDIIDGQVAEGFFSQCPITFKDISEAKEVLIESLKTIYHTRITYPTLNDNNTKPATKSRSSMRRRWGLK